MTDILGPASAPNAVTSRITESRTFGPVDTWFQPCSNPASQDGTQVQAAWLNGMMAVLRVLLRGNGSLGVGGPVVPEDNTDAMLLTAVRALIQRGQDNYCIDTGTTNAMVANLPFAPAELKFGMRVYVMAAASPTGAATLKLNGFTLPVVRHDNSACIGNEWSANQVVELILQSGGWQIEGLTKSDLPFNPSAGASTQKAPLLCLLDAKMAATQPAPSATDTLLVFGTFLGSNFVTSTWTGSRFTVGAGESGWYYIKAAWCFTPTANSNFTVCRLMKNRSTYVGDEPAMTLTPVGGGYILTSQSLVKLAVGDFVEAYANHQATSTQTIYPDPVADRTHFKAELVSAY